MPQDLMQDAFETDVIRAAQLLVGAILVRGNMRAKVVETEAYRAEDDPACHAYRRKTMKNGALFGPPGMAYVYLNYGVHWMLNVAAHAPGQAAGVLIRAAEPLAGIEEMRANRPSAQLDDLLRGPGKLCRAMGITSHDNGLDLFDPKSPMHLLPASEEVPFVAGRRIGLAKGKGDELEWRFADKERLIFVSRPVPPAYR